MIDRFARVVADRLGSMLERGAGGGRGGGGRRGPSKLRGRKLEMRCRYPGCTNRSKGPRFRFLCETHRRLPKKKQDEALKKWAAKNG
ncbi:MAG: hypothetical protein E6J78_15585 [Deltaproteobacteria bacterium]|nr:MAG: hypothetical protein E6J78_15585 [Deltaproteobacteria bacterium]